MKLTFGNIKATLAKVLNMNSSDSRVIDFCNRAVERLTYEGKWVDTTCRYVVCLSSGGCITWPRDIETIEAFAICNTPGIIRNGWFSFLANGPGLGCGPCGTLEDRGNAVAFDDVNGTGKKIAISCDGAENTTTSYVLLRYYDSMAQKVYTNDPENPGTIIEGEKILLPASPGYTYTAREVLPFGLYEVIKPVTNFPIRLFEYDVSAATYRALAYYEPDETLPNYRRSYIPQLSNAGSGEGGCGLSKVTIVAKRRFIPATGDSSVLLISHADAIRLAAQAIYKEECNMLIEAETYWQKAMQCLNSQLHHYQGDGVVAPLRIVGAESYGGGITNLI